MVFIINLSNKGLPRSGSPQPILRMRGMYCIWYMSGGQNCKLGHPKSTPYYFSRPHNIYMRISHCLIPHSSICPSASRPPSQQSVVLCLLQAEVAVFPSVSPGHLLVGKVSTKPSIQQNTADRCRQHSIIGHTRISPQPINWRQGQSIPWSTGLFGEVRHVQKLHYFCTFR